MLHIKKVKPLFTNIVTTADKFSKDDKQQGIIIHKKGDLKPWQKVIAVGSTVRDIHEGDTVMINLMNYAVKKYSKDSLQNDLDNNPTMKFSFNTVSIDDEDGKSHLCLLLTDRDVEYIFEGEEKETSSIVVPDNKLIV